MFFHPGKKGPYTQCKTPWLVEKPENSAKKPTSLKLNWSSKYAMPWDILSKGSWHLKFKGFLAFSGKPTLFETLSFVAFEKVLKIPQNANPLDLVEEFYLVLIAVLFFSVLIMNVFIGVICVPWYQLHRISKEVVVFITPKMAPKFRSWNYGEMAEIKLLLLLWLCCIAIMILLCYDII